MPNKSKPSRRKIKKAIVNMANLTGLPIKAWRDMLKTPSALRRIDEFLKANTWYPISCGDTSRDLESGPLFTVDVQYHGEVEDSKPVTLPYSAFLMEPPKHGLAMSPEKYRENMNKLKELIAKAPTAIEGMDVKDPTTSATNTQEEDGDAFARALRKQITENVGVDLDVAPLDWQMEASDIHNWFKDYLYPHSDYDIDPQQFEQMQRLIERLSPLPKKRIIFTTPGRRNESVSSFLALWKQSLEKSEWKSHFFPEDAKLVVHQSKKRAEGPLVSGDPQYIFSMPASLKDLTDEHPRTDEPHQGTDPVPGDTEPGT